MTKPKLRHIAMSVEDPFATADFYQNAFDMEKVGETDSPLARGVYLSDGTICLAILKFKSNYWAGNKEKEYIGIHHMGFWVDDLDSSHGAIESAGGTYFAGRPDPSEGDISQTHYEVKYHDPNSIMVELSSKGWDGASRD